MHPTVMIGRTGPNISSAMIGESSGGFSNIVGSINLHKIGQVKTMQRKVFCLVVRNGK